MKPTRRTLFGMLPVLATGTEKKLTSGGDVNQAIITVGLEALSILKKHHETLELLERRVQALEERVRMLVR